MALKKDLKINNITESKGDIYSYFFEYANDAIVVMDKEGKTIRMNKRASEISGLDIKDIAGKKFTELGILSEDSTKLAIKNFRDKMRGKNVVPYEVEIIPKGKDPIKVEVNYLLTKDLKGIKGEVLVLHEVTEKRKEEARTIALNRALSLISKVNKLLVKSKDRKELMDEICRLIVGTDYYSLAWIALFQEGQNSNKEFSDISFCGKNAKDLNKYILANKDKSLLASHIGVAIMSNKVSFFRDLPKIPKSPEGLKIYSKLGVKSALAVPIKEGSNIFGVLLVCSEKEDAFISSETSILEEMAGDLVYGLKALKIKSERDSAHQLLIWQRDLIFELSQAKDFDSVMLITKKAILSLPEITSGGFYLIDERKNSLELVSPFGLSKKFIDEAASYKLSSPQGKLVLSGKSMFIAYEKLSVNKSDTRLKEGLKAIGVIPVVYQNEVIGCFNVASKKHYEITASTQKFLEIIGQIFGVMVNRFKTEQKVIDEKKFSDETIESIPGLFYVTDSRGNFLRWNKNQLLFLGFNSEDLKNKNAFFDFSVLAENKAEVGDSLKEALSLGESSIEFILKSENNEKKYFHLINKRIKIGGNDYLIGIGIDQTERRKIEQKLSEAISHYENIAANTTDIIFLKDRDRRYVFVNGAMEKLVGLPIEKIVGKTPEEIFSGQSK